MDVKTGTAKKAEGRKSVTREQVCFPQVPLLNSLTENTVEHESSLQDGESPNFQERQKSEILLESWLTDSSFEADVPIAHLPLLEKNRYLNDFLQQAGPKIDLYLLAESLRNVTNANTYILDYEGRILGSSLLNEQGCEPMATAIQENGYFPERYNKLLVKSNKLRYNIWIENDRCSFTEDAGCIFSQKVVMALPVVGKVAENCIRLGTLLLERIAKAFNVEDLILSERSAAVIERKLLQEKMQQSAEEKRNKDVVSLAAGNLSMTETKAVKHVLSELEGGDGLLVATNAALELGIDRSVIIKALHKLKTGAIVESRSLGMKGTYIKVLNPYLYEYMEVREKKAMG